MALYTISSSGSLHIQSIGSGDPIPTLAVAGIASSAISGSPVSGDSPTIWIIPRAPYYAGTSPGQLVISSVDQLTPISQIRDSGIASTSIAEAPITGNDSVIWTIKPVPSFTSSGLIQQIPVTLSTQSGLGASAIGEFPITGILDNIPEVEVGLFSASGSLASHGNLSISGETVVHKAYNIFSNGELLVPQTYSNAVTTLHEYSSGNIDLVKSDLVNFAPNISTSGSLLTTTEDVYKFTANISTNGLLQTITNTDAHRAWIRTTNAEAVLSGATVTKIILVPQSSGALRFTDYGYLTNFTGGIASDPLSSQSIASGNVAEIITTQISFYGDINSSGNIVIETTGERVGSISSASGIAGSAVADAPISGSLDTIFAATTYEDLWNEDSSATAYISGASGFGYTFTTAGNLTYTGTGEFNFSRNRSSAGNVVLFGSTTQNALRNEDSSGQLVEVSLNERTVPLSDSSGIAGSAIASIPIGGGKDLQQINTFEALWNELTSGVPVVSGTTFQSSLRNESSDTGNIVFENTNEYNSRRNELTTGSLKISTSDTFTLLIAANSHGVLRLFDADTANVIQIEESHGNQVLTGNTVSARTLTFLTHGLLHLSTTDSYNSLQNEDSTGSVATLPAGEYVVPLSDSSGIAGSAIASIPLGSGMDNYPITTTFTELLNEPTTGNLVISGNTIVVRTLDFLSHGYLASFGNTVFDTVKSEASHGNLNTNGSIVDVIKLHATSSGNLSTLPYGYTSTSANSGGISGSAIASIPVSGSLDDNRIAVLVSYISRGIYYNGLTTFTSSSGSIAISGSDTVEAITGKSEVSHGLLLITTSDSYEFTKTLSTHGNLLSVSSSQIARAYGTESNGYLSSTGSDTVIYISGAGQASAGNLYLVPSDTYSLTVNALTSGNAIVSGTSAVDKASSRESAGQIVIAGSSNAEFIPANLNIKSAGLLKITATTTVEFKIKPPVRRQNQGGSYVFASSWDILTPYFKDDRHILGYIPAGTEDTRKRKISGSTTFTVIRGTPSLTAKPDKFDFLKTLPKLAKDPIIKPVQETNDRLRKQIMLEDELLLGGSLLDIDDPDDELNRELMR